ncbi:BgTH12-04499 [Blumeria graminis f. sp. triticale]|uniref:BgTH12-04499 n=1 Tax=Blumeria graminis f. sp. triticale TaxID=1689686 RepID=A0A9W4CUT9_BLUGR|nr:BgTH12-04499 [Blumeria graminis f. sp. triticale]
MIRYGPEFQSHVFNEGIRSTVKVADNNNSDDYGAQSADLKSTKTGKNKYIPAKGEKEQVSRWEGFFFASDFNCVCSYLAMTQYQRKVQKK